ncbi:MAG: hypothetical protein RR212_14670 [Bacteroidales bacterium]
MSVNLSLFADDDDQPVFLQVGDDAIKASIQTNFESFQGPLYSDPGLPAFTLISRNNKIAVGIGGYVRFTTSFDFGGIMPNRDFIPFLLPVPVSSAQRSQFIMDASTSRVFLRFLADTKLGLFHFFVETDFRASQNRNRFTAIYASMGGWRIGRYWSVMADLDSYPPSVDFQGPNSFAGTSTYQISYQGNFNKHFSFGLGIELPDYSIADSLDNYRQPQRIPTIPGYLQYNNEFGHIRVASLARPLIYKNGLSGSTEYAMTWGVIGSAFIQTSRKMTFYLQSMYGSGIGTYNFELNGGGWDLIPDVARPGKLRPAKFWGGFAGTKYNFSAFFQASAIYSCLRVLKNDLRDPDVYKTGQYVVTTGYFNLTPRMQLAIEYDFGYLRLRNNQHGRSNRLIGMIRYDF